LGLLFGKARKLGGKELVSQGFFPLEERPRKFFGKRARKESYSLINWVNLLNLGKFPRVLVYV